MDPKILFDCRPEECFWTCNGRVLRNVYELVSYVKTSDDYSFKYHKNNEKDDFGKWIRDVFDDYILSDRLNNVFDKLRYADIIEQRVKELED
ncbi:MAG: hypothetical protein ACMXX9_00435 [Candidatus Woesearchaeota archaeon]